MTKDNKKPIALNMVLLYGTIQFLMTIHLASIFGAKMDSHLRSLSLYQKGVSDVSRQIS